MLQAPSDIEKFATEFRHLLLTSPTSLSIPGFLCYFVLLFAFYGVTNCLIVNLFLLLQRNAHMLNSHIYIYIYIISYLLRVSVFFTQSSGTPCVIYSRIICVL
jgi:hypothetical protein